MLLITTTKTLFSEWELQRSLRIAAVVLLSLVLVSQYFLLLAPIPGGYDPDEGQERVNSAPAEGQLSYIPPVELAHHQQSDPAVPPLSIPRPNLCWFGGCMVKADQVPVTIDNNAEPQISNPVAEIDPDLDLASSDAASTSLVPDDPEAPAQAPFVTGPPYRYVFPVQPPHLASYIDDHHTYPATDIFAPVGTEFVAVTDGIVYAMSRVDTWDPAVNDPATRSGLFISILGDDGVRYHGSHLDSVVEGIEQGVRVSAGQLLGYVGRSGNARNTPPHIHFGISYPTYPDDWQIRRGVIWPYRYLKAWTRGESLTPDLSGVRR